MVDSPSVNALFASVRVTFGAASSSVRVKSAEETVTETRLFEAVPVTSTIRPDSSAVLSTALMVAVSLLFEVAPPGMVMVASAPTV